MDCGDILLEVHETKTAFVLKLLEQQVRYDAPQIDNAVVFIPAAPHKIGDITHVEIQDAFDYDLEGREVLI